MQIVKFLTQSALLLLAVLTALSFLGGYYWLFDYVAHGRIQLLFFSALGLFATGFLTIKTSVRKFSLLLSGLVFAANLYPVATFYFDDPPSMAENRAAPILRVMSVNILTRNNRYADVMEEIVATDPDLLLVMEVDRLWMRELAQLSQRYPHRVGIVTAHNFGMVLFSKTPFASKQIYEWGRFRIPYINATIRQTNGQVIRVYGVHAVPPVRKERLRDNQQQRKVLMTEASQFEGPVIMLGDWNDTPWSRSYKQILSGTGFKNAASGSIPLPTWRPFFFGGLMIDHIFVKGFQIRNWHVGGDIGSDHRAVIAEVQVQEPR